MEKFESFIDIRIQDESGDKKLKISWDNGNDESAKLSQEKIKVLFNDLKDNGYRFFKVEKKFGIFKTKGIEVSDYDPSLGELIYEKGENVEIEKNSDYDSSLSEAICEKEENTEIKKFSFQECTIEDDYLLSYENISKFDPSIEEASEEHAYIATRPMKAG